MSRMVSTMIFSFNFVRKLVLCPERYWYAAFSCTLLVALSGVVLASVVLGGRNSPNPRLVEN
eukprot:1045021-Amphidinium_carterae.1